MITFPARITKLIERLEAGDDPTPEELARLGRLQALDVARIGEEYVQQAVAENERRTEEFRQILEA